MYNHIKQRHSIKIRSILFAGLFVMVSAGIWGILPLFGNDTPSVRSEETKKTPALQRDPDSRLQNFIKISPRFYSGGEPKDDDAFSELKQLGIKIIISVDGLQPNLKSATKQGLNYIHIPIGYDTVPQSAQLQLLRVAREMEGPIYVHCHHGRHRGPAAMAVLCQAAGFYDSSQAVHLLKEAGTSPQYDGLWKSVAEYQLPDPETQLPQLTSAAEVDSIAENMAHIDRLFDELTAWVKKKAPQPKSSPQEIALLLKELMFESGRALKENEPEKAELIKFFKSAEQSAISVQNSLKSDHNLNNGVVDQAWQSLKQECRRCHDKFRN